MNIKNVFLTGAIKCGKSTLINNILQKLNISYSGYRTLPYYINDIQQGFYIQSYIENENICKPISVKIEDYKMIPIIETFELIGVDILKKSISDLNSKIILLDEPNTFLDYVKQHDFFAFIKNLIKENNLINIITVHDINLALRYADKIVILNENKIVDIINCNIEGYEKKFVDIMEKIYDRKLEISYTKFGPFIVC